jgi:hypothetical protein
MPGYRSGPDREHEAGLPSFAELCGTGPSLSPQELSSAVLEQMGERPAGYSEHRRLQYRGGHPDTSALREHMGLD